MAVVYDKDKRYRKVVYQLGGKPVLPEELNIQQDVAQSFLDDFIAQLAGACCHGDGFLISESTSNTNNFLISAGTAWGYTGWQIYLASNTEYTGQTDYSPATLTTPVGANRTDIVYLHAYITSIDSTDDSTIVHPILGIETAIRDKVVIEVVVLEDAVVGDVPISSVTHTYIPLAQIDRLDGDATITDAMITDIREILPTGLATLWTGTSFDADKVDNRDVDDTEETNLFLWTAEKVVSYVEERDFHKGTVVDQVDFTTSEPTPSAGEKYINTVTGTGSITTGTTFTENYIYEYHNSSWREIIPEEGSLVRDNSEDDQFIYDGTDWLSLSAYLAASISTSIISAKDSAGLRLQDDASNGFTITDGGNVEFDDGLEIQVDKVRAIDGDGLALQDDGDNGLFVEDGGAVGVNLVDAGIHGQVSINVGRNAENALALPAIALTDYKPTEVIYSRCESESGGEIESYFGENLTIHGTGHTFPTGKYNNGFQEAADRTNYLSFPASVFPTQNHGCIELWFKHVAFSTDPAGDSRNIILGNDNSDVAGFADFSLYYGFVSAEQHLYLSVADTVLDFTGGTAYSDDLDDGNWHHIAVAWDTTGTNLEGSNKVSLYLNNVYVGGSDTLLPPFTYTNYTIGGYYPIVDEDWDASQIAVDEITVHETYKTDFSDRTAEKNPAGNKSAYNHYITTEHLIDQGEGNKVHFYTGNGTADNTLSNAVRNLTLSNGKVGIGTSSPSSKLEMYSAGNEDYNAIIIRNSTRYSRFQSINAADGNYQGNALLTSNFKVTSVSGVTSSHVLSGTIDNTNLGSAVLRVSGHTGGDVSEVAFYTAASVNTTPLQRMVINKDGKVGIGTSSPSTKLVLEENSHQILFDPDNGSSSAQISSSSGMGTDFYVNGSTHALKIHSDGHVQRKVLKSTMTRTNKSGLYTLLVNTGLFSVDEVDVAVTGSYTLDGSSTFPLTSIFKSGSAFYGRVTFDGGAGNIQIAEASDSSMASLSVIYL